MKKAFLQLHIAVFLAGFTAILGKLIGLNEGLLVWYRMLITAAAVWFIMYINKRLRPLTFKQALPLLLTGTIIAFHWVMFYGSVKYGSVSIAVVCFSATGFFTAFFGPLINRHKIIPGEVLLGLLSIAGIWIIFDFHPQFKTGIIFGLLSAVGSSLFPIFNKQLLEKYDAETMVLWEMIGGLVLLGLLIPVYLNQFPASYFLPTPADVFWLLILSLACTVYSFHLQLSSLKKISAFTTNLTYNLEPVYGIILAFLIFRENRSFNSHFYIGVLLILLSVLLQMWRVWRLGRRPGLAVGK